MEQQLVLVVIATTICDNNGVIKQT